MIRRPVSLLLVAGAVWLSLIPTLQAADLNGNETLKKYLELVASGNADVALDLWEPAAIARSSRFPIVYTDAKLKIDCSSQFDPEATQHHVSVPARSVESIDGDNAFRLGYSGGFGDGLTRNAYVARKSGDYFYLTYPQDVYAANWPVDSSTYFRIRYHPSTIHAINPVSRAAADQFVDQMIDSLGLLKTDRELLRKAKIEFFLCDSDSTVRKISGVPVKGLLDLSSNDLISSTFPHHHEVIHLLVNLKLRSVPMFTLPLFREGVAVQHGGRWSKMPSALVDLGAFLYTQELVTLDSLLTFKSFGVAGADISYPVAAAFCGFLTERLGRDKFFALYRDLSASYDSLYRLDHDAVRATILSHAGLMNWPELLAEFDAYIAAQTANPQFARPGAGEKSKKLMAAKNWKLSEQNDWLLFQFTANSPDSIHGSYLCVRDKTLAAGKSPTDSTAGFRFAVRVDKNEARLYDLATNYLLAKYIWGITPSDQYFDSTSNTISIRFRKSLFGSSLPRVTEFMSLSL